MKWIFVGEGPDGGKESDGGSLRWGLKDAPRSEQRFSWYEVPSNHQWQNESNFRVSLLRSSAPLANATPNDENTNRLIESQPRQKIRETSSCERFGWTISQMSSLTFGAISSFDM